MFILWKKWLNNKLINNQSLELSYTKNYNKTLKEKYKFLYYHNNDYSLHLAIYQKSLYNYYQEQILEYENKMDIQ